MNAVKSRQIAMNPATLKAGVVVLFVGVASVLAFLFQDRWLPEARALIASSTGSPDSTDIKGHAEHDGHDGHDGHDHGHDHGHDGHPQGHAGHDEANSLELSPQARRNVGLSTAAIELTTFVRNATIPAMVIGRPGRSAIEVTALLGGRVTRVYPVEGEAVEPGQPLFDLRLMHEELVQAQSEFLRIAEELEVVAREIKRLESVQVPGAIPGKTIREREYEQQKLQAVFNAQRQSLLLHGLAKEQIAGILEKRTLVQLVTVVAPEHPRDGNAESPSAPFTVRELRVKPGQYVDAGATLCQLMDYGQLYIQGRGFEQDADELLRAAREGWDITATRDGNNRRADVVKKLKIVYVDNEVEPESRALHFYVGLPNQVVHESTSADGHRFVTWQHKPGQRMKLHVPVEQWADRIVLPIDAVAKEGVEYYVFQQHGNHFDRVPVQVEYQDQFSAVIANDGSVVPGDIVATSGAHQLQMALKNKAGGGVDPHAGHTH